LEAKCANRSGREGGGDQNEHGKSITPTPTTGPNENNPKLNILTNHRKDKTHESGGEKEAKKDTLRRSGQVKVQNEADKIKNKIYHANKRWKL